MIPWFSSLRGRLVMWYVVVLVMALLVFGTGAVVVIDRDLRASLDARLQTTAAAARNIVDVKQGRISMDERDREQMFALLGAQTEVVVVRGSNDVIFTSVVRPASALIRLAQATGFADVSNVESETVRAVVLPISIESKRAGAVIAWTTTAWIQGTDRRIAVAFALAALLLAAVASVAGSAVTRRALEDAFTRQRRFTADASHELRAPLAVIRAEADLALRKQRDAKVYERALDTIAVEADRLESLVSALLSAARAENARAKPAVIDLAPVVQRVCERFEPTAVAKDVSVNVSDGQPCHVRGTEDALERALTAIVHNAIKHTPSGGHIDVWTTCKSRRAEICVRDGGPGFSAAALVHGLEWFWCDNPSRSGDASGLGLAIADSIARSSGGNIRLLNSVEGGAQVVISLPAV
jgi:signal transduction histidine kinase